MPSHEQIRAEAATLRELSRAERARAQRTCAASAQIRQRTAALRILIVEDHADSAEAIKKLLVHDGHEVAVAGTVCDALRLSAESHFTRLQCDIGLPDGSGLDLVRTLKRAHPELRAIALSGFAMPHDVEQALQAGFDAHLAKPVTMEQLLTTLQRTP